MKKNLASERNREATEHRLLETIGAMIRENGFEKIGINAVATQSGVSKILIYRYFGSVEGLMAAYLRKHDFWLNHPMKFPIREELPSFLKKLFREQVAKLRSNLTLKRLYRWELSCNNEMITTLREQREKVGLKLIEKVSEVSGYSKLEMASMVTILNASITYLVLLEDTCPYYNGIFLNQDRGWEEINQGIDAIIDKYLGK